MQKKLIREKIKAWALDMHKFNEPVPAERLYQLAAKTFYKDKWDAIHWTESINQYKLLDKERMQYESEMKKAWDYMEPIEKQLFDIIFEVIDELEETGIDLS